MVLVALLGIPASALFAQSNGSWFKVPFEFTVRGNAMPAGDYFVENLFWWNVVVFRGTNKTAGLIVLAEALEQRQIGVPKLVFHRYDNDYMLSSIELRNTDYARTFQTEVVSHVIKVGKTVTQARPAIVEIAGR
jgi:hypothetical protein